MKLTDKLSSELKHAMIAKDTTRLSVIRAIKTEISKEETSPKNAGRELTDSDVLGLIRRVAKRHEDSISQFLAGKRDDLVKTETAELEVVKSFLPAQLSPEALDLIIGEVVTEFNSASKKDMGKMIKRVNELYPGQIDGKTLSARLMQTLV